MFSGAYAIVGLFRHAVPKQLSGGMKQRASRIARRAVGQSRGSLLMELNRLSALDKPDARIA